MLLGPWMMPSQLRPAQNKFGNGGQRVWDEVLCTARRTFSLVPVGPVNLFTCFAEEGTVTNQFFLSGGLLAAHATKHLYFPTFEAHGSTALLACRRLLVLQFFWVGS